MMSPMSPAGPPAAPSTSSSVPPDPADLARLIAGSDRARASGRCTRPVRLAGSRSLVDARTGEVVHRLDSAGLPGGVIAVPCRNRRASVCPVCSDLYKYDAYHLIVAGLRGGKDVPATVAGHPRLFVTLTAPSYGPVHAGPDRRGRPRLCRAHRKGLSCRIVHHGGDPVVGTPLDSASYDYVGHVLFNACAGALWSRFTIETRRCLAESAGISRTALGQMVRVAFAKVAEYQARGVIHFHAVLRLDGPDGPGSPPPSWATADLLAAALRSAARRVSVRTPGSRLAPARLLRWGRQLDIRPITPTGDSAGDDGGRSEVVAARYIAKYATKGTETVGAAVPPLACRNCHGSGLTIMTIDGTDHMRPCRSCHGTGRTVNPATLGLSAHVQALVDTCWRLGGVPELAGLGLRRWAHTFGFGGHFATKSRTYSTTFTGLRAERAAYTAHHQADRLGLPTGDAHLVIGDWRYAGRGAPDEAGPPVDEPRTEHPASHGQVGGGR